MIKPLFLGVAGFFFFLKRGKKGETRLIWGVWFDDLEKIPYENNLLLNFILL